MILYFLDRSLTVVGTASTDLTGTLIISSDSKTEDVDTGSSTLDCDIVFSSEDRLRAEEIVAVGNVVMRYDPNDISRQSDPDATKKDIISTRNTIDGFHDVFSIIETEVDVQNSTINFYAEDGGLDLLNDLADAYTGTNLLYSDYVKQALARTEFILRDSVATADLKSLSLEFKQTDNVLARLQEIASDFEYEFSFGFDILGMKIVDKWIEFTKERGTDTKKVIATDREINNIQIKKTIEKLATALYPTGSDSLTLAGYDYDDGEDFFVADQYLMSRKALAKWQKGDGGHIYRSFSYETSDQKELLEESIKELKKRVEPEVEYTIDLAYLPDGVHVGDRINVVDDAGELYLSGRVLKLVTSIVNDKKTVTFGEWLVKSSGISEKVQELATKFKSIADTRTFYTWFAYADDASGTNISLDPKGKTYMGIAANKIEPEPDDESKLNPKDFKWTVIEEPDTVENISLTISSSEGTIFYRTFVKTTLTAHVYYGGVEVTKDDISSLLNCDLVWYKIVNGSEQKVPDEYIQQTKADVYDATQRYFILNSDGSYSEVNITESEFNEDKTKYYILKSGTNVLALKIDSNEKKADYICRLEVKDE